MQNEESTESGRPLVMNRTVDIVVSLLLLAGCAIVIYDSARIGFGWREGEGPAPGAFPFYVALILGISSLINLISAVRGEGRQQVFVSLRPFGRVLAVLIPSIAYVALIQYLGIYVASAIYIFVFMVLIGRENLLKALGVSLAVPVALFLMFERWFLVPLPKGPVEAWLGF
jgi:hypothetical protein